MGLNIVDNKVESHWHVSGLIRALMACLDV